MAGNTKKWSEILKLGDFLEKNYPDNVLMQMKPETKRPVASHKGWSWEKYKKNIIPNKDDYEISMVLKTFIVIDFDTQEVMAEWFSKFPILQSVPFETSKKGGHLYFKRPAICDHIGIFDKAFAFGKKDHGAVDFKTIAQTGTGGLMKCYPSTDRLWVRSIFDYPLIDFPDEIIDYYMKNGIRLGQDCA